MIANQLASKDSFNPLKAILNMNIPILQPILTLFDQILVKFELTVYNAVQATFNICTRLINDPWAPTEIWFILVWFVAYRRVLRFAFGISEMIRKSLSAMVYQFRRAGFRAQTQLARWRGDNADVAEPPELALMRYEVSPRRRSRFGFGVGWLGVALGNY